MLDPKLAVLAVSLGGAGVLGVGAVGAGAYAVHARGGFCGRHGGARAEMAHKFINFVVNEKLDEIDATDAQRQKVNEVRDRLMKEGHALHEGRDEMREELLTLLAQDNPDPARVKAAVHARAEAFTRFADDAVDGLLEIHAALTPAQRAQLLADAREHMGAREN